MRSLHSFTSSESSIMLWESRYLRRSRVRMRLWRSWQKKLTGRKSWNCLCILVTRYVCTCKHVLNIHISSRIHDHTDFQPYFEGWIKRHLNICGNRVRLTVAAKSLIVDDSSLTLPFWLWRALRWRERDQSLPPAPPREDRKAHSYPFQSARSAGTTETCEQSSIVYI